MTQTFKTWYLFHFIQGLVEAEDASPDTEYYQWVPFLFVVNALIFLIPKNLWKWAEGGFIKSLVTDQTKSKHVSQNIQTGDPNALSNPNKKDSAPLGDSLQ